ERLAGVPVPGHDGLALVRHADRRELAAGRVERLTRHGARHVPDLGSVVLHPARPREVLAELAVGAPGRAAVLVEHDAGRPRGALVDREDQDGGSLPRRYLPAPCPTWKLTSQEPCG